MTFCMPEMYMMQKHASPKPAMHVQCENKIIPLLLAALQGWSGVAVTDCECRTVVINITLSPPSLAEPHPRVQAARGSGVMLYFGLYHSCRISAVQSDCRTGHTSRFMLHPPRVEQAKQPTWTFEPEANVNAYDCTSSNVRKMITSSHSFGTNRSKA